MQPPPNNERDAVEQANGQPLLDRLKRLGITSWREPLLCLPKLFQDYSSISTLKQALPQNDVVAGPKLFTLLVSEKAVVVSQPKKRLVMTATDGMLSVKIVIFVVQGVDVPTWKAFEESDKIHLRGVLQNWNGKLQITGPALIGPQLVGKVIPVYEKRRSVVADGAIYDATRYALEHHLKETIDYLVESYHGFPEAEILRRARLKAPSIEVILRAAHQPTSEDEGMRGIAGMRRLAALSVVENARRLKKRAPVPESVVSIPDTLIQKLTAKLPYPLTGDQHRSIGEIVADMASPLPMRRVLSGDVGSGKTLPIMIAALATQSLGHRAVILTPNGLLADQFVKECKALFGEDSQVISVTSGTKKLDLSGNPILVGTTALLTRLKGEPPPALFCVDEEQKMSVSQKVELTGFASNCLQATATPIPRTTALITHGAMDVSVLKEMPVVKNITTYIVTAGERKRLFDHTRKVLASGGQIAIVYPIVNDDEQEKKSVVAAAAEWDKQFPGLVGMVHGQMKEAEKVAAVDGLKSGNQKIAVVSSVIEIGLTLPSLRSLIVVHAERYGTSTLHQLRGRVARLGGNGYFFLFLPESVAPETMQRLQLLVDYSDGFTLSEKDADLRGYGDLFEDAERQSGNSRSTIFRCVDLTPSEIHAATINEAPPS